MIYSLSWMVQFKYLIRKNHLLILLVALTLTRGLIYVAVTVPWSQGDDEEIHFGYTKSLVDHWIPNQTGQNILYWPQEMAATFAAFPRGRWNEIPEGKVNLTNVGDPYQNFTRRQSLSYHLYAWVGKFLAQQDILFQLFALRLVSVFITGGTITFVFLCAGQIFKADPLLQILVPWLILFTPSFMVIDTAINDGNLTVLLVTIVFYLLLLEISRSRSGWRLTLALVLTILAFWTKATAYFLLIVWSVLLIIWVWKLGRKYWLWLGVIIGTMVASLLFLPAYFIDRLESFQERLSSGGLTFAGIAYALSYEYLRDTFASFWIILGFLTYWLAPIWYTILFTLLLLAVLGSLLYIWRFVHFGKFNFGIEQQQLLLSLLFVASAIGVLLTYVAIRNHDGLRLGRYIFPAIGPLSILMTAGWRELLPNQWQNLGITLLIAFFFLFDTLFWLNYAIPWYYPFWP